MSRRARFTQQRILALMQTRQQLSYDSISAELDIDYKTAVNVVRRLEAQKLIIITRGRGRIPNSYQIAQQTV